MFYRNLLFSATLSIFYYSSLYFLKLLFKILMLAIVILIVFTLTSDFISHTFVYSHGFFEGESRLNFIVNCSGCKIAITMTLV